MDTRTESLVAHFDGWYADMAGSPVNEIQQRHLGLPSYLLSTSLLTWEGIAEVAEALRITPGGTLLDLGCGRGGYGLEVAHRAGTGLIGVDFSAEAIRQAREYAVRLGRTAGFLVGDLAATGLDEGSVDGVMCVDAIQFAADTEAAFRELLRVLRPGGRAALTGWAPVDPDAEGVPDRLRAMAGLGTRMAAAGFAEVEEAHRPAWRERERLMWEEAAALDPGDSPSLRSFHDEGVRSLRSFDLLRRVMVTATVT